MLIPFQPNEDGNIYKPTSARYGLLAILDMIATAAAEARGPKVLESLRRIKHILNTLTIDDPRLPLETDFMPIKPKNICEVDTPAILVDVDRVVANIEKAQAHADAAGVKLRPHIKTHKLPFFA